MTTYTVDWLTFTVEGTRDLDGLNRLAEELFFAPTTKVCKPSHGYKWAIRTYDGMILQSGVREDMHTNVICSGSSISELSATFSHTPQWFVDCLKRARSVSRIDLAIDSHETPFLANLIALVRNGGYTCAAQSYKVIDSGAHGLTLYLGERSSERMMRIYDKAAEMGVDGQAWTRFELEIKGEAAKRCAKQIIQDGVYRVVTGWIDAYANFPIAPWKALLGDDKATYAPSQRKVRDGREWLIQVVSPMIAKRMNEGDKTLLQEMLAVIMSYR